MTRRHKALLNKRHRRDVELGGSVVLVPAEIRMLILGLEANFGEFKDIF